jgi:hypothetical protein
MRQLIDYFTSDDRRIESFKGVLKTRKEILGSINSKREHELIELYKKIAKLHKANRLDYGYLVSDVSLAYSNVSLVALAPSGPSLDRFAAQAAKRDSKNEQRTTIDKNGISGILVIEGPDHQLLICGDASKHALGDATAKWRKVCAKSKKSPKFDVIKVSHHGSDRCHSEGLWKDFTRGVKSSAAISAGCKQGHPGFVTVRGILDKKVEIYCTNKSGALRTYKLRIRQDISKCGLSAIQMEALQIQTHPVIDSADVAPLHGNIEFEFDNGNKQVNTQYPEPAIRTI